MSSFLSLIVLTIAILFQAFSVQSPYSSTERASDLSSMAFQKEEKISLYQTIQLQNKSEDDLLSGITAMAITRSGQIFVLHENGYKITRFDKIGAPLETIQFEQVYGPGQSRLGQFERIIPIDEMQIAVLSSGLVKELVIYDSNKEDFQLVAYHDKPRVHAFTDLAGSSSTHLFLLEHPRRVLGQEGIPRITITKNSRRVNSFEAFPALQFPILSEHFAPWGDRIVLFGNNDFCVSTPLSDRIYRYDFFGQHLGDLVYPKGFLQQPNADASQDPRQWKNQIAEVKAKCDRIKDIFPIKKNNRLYLVIARAREKSLYLDLFSDNGKFVSIGEYTEKFFGDNLITISNLNEYLYVLNWPEVETNQFKVSGNPQISMFKVNVENIMASLQE